MVALRRCPWMVPQEMTITRVARDDGRNRIIPFGNGGLRAVARLVDRSVLKRRGQVAVILSVLPDIHHPIAWIMIGLHAGSAFYRVHWTKRITHHADVKGG